MSPTRMSHRGFTLIELSLTLAIILIVTTLLLPAVQQQRQRARNESCKINLKRIGLALHNYHDVHNVFPPGWITHTPYAQSPSGLGWQYCILPFVEEAPLYNEINGTIPTGKGAFEHQKVANLKKEIEPFRCPADTMPPENSIRGGWGTSNYSGNHGSVALPRFAMAGTAFEWPGSLMTPITADGIFYWNSSLRFRDITDGTSNTFAVGERSGLGGAGIWSGVRSNSIESDVVSTGAPGREINSHPEAYSSQHGEGAHFLLCDGSVHFISSKLDSHAADAEQNLPPGIFQKLSSRNDGMVIDEF